MITLRDISIAFGDHQVLTHLNLSIGDREVVGLIGKNGAGKSTLFRVIAAELQADSGSVEPGNETILFLPQYPKEHAETVISFLNSGPVSRDEYEIKNALNQVLLSHVDEKQLMSDLSGGEKTKIYFAKMLLAEPSPTVLLLDEPTNNLDLEGIVWLENFIASFEGSVLLTSHDRRFLDETVDSIIELHDGNSKRYGGNYSFYREEKEKAEVAYRRRYSAQQKKIQQIETDIQRTESRARSGEERFSSGMPYQRKKIRKSAEQMAHRKKKLIKFLSSTNRLEKPQEHILSYISLQGMTYANRSLIHVKELNKSLNNRHILKNVSFVLSGNDRVWLYGPNGSGKTTLFKLILDQMKPDNGTIVVSSGIRLGYFSQNRDDMNPNHTVLVEFLAMGLTQTLAYKIGINFHFLAEEMQKKIGELSVGQRAKVSFAKLTSGIYQLLILDEPTNHLEIETREIIEKALNAYEGALLIASHDRYFLDQIGMNRMLVLQDGILKENKTGML